MLIQSSYTFLSGRIQIPALPQNAVGNESAWARSHQHDGTAETS